MCSYAWRFALRKCDKMNELQLQPLVSIVIPVYNGADFLREAIDSALAQTYNNIEIIVVNDGSDDDNETERIALSYGDKVRYLYKTNGGVATALNYGIENMRGDYFSWLSHDDLYLPNKIDEQIKLLGSLIDQTSIISCPFTLIDANDNEITRVDPREYYTDEQLLRPLFPLMFGQICGCCLLIHRSHFLRVGGFNADLRTTQDCALWFDMMRGRSVYFTKDVLVKIRKHDAQGTKRLLPLHLIECDALWMGVMSDITTVEMDALCESELEFYEKYNDYLKLTPYKKASAYAGRMYKISSALDIEKKQLDETKGQLTDTLSQLYDTLNQLTNLNNQYHESQSQLTNIQNQLYDTQIRLIETLKENTDVQNQLANSLAQLTTAHANIDELNNKLDAVKHSTSWRITKPLRFVKRIISGGE